MDQALTSPASRLTTSASHTCPRSPQGLAETCFETVENQEMLARQSAGVMNSVTLTLATTRRRGHTGEPHTAAHRHRAITE